MLKLEEDIENVIINKYLDVNDKIKLLLTCKYFNKKININYHIGTLIKSHLRLDEKNQHDLIILTKHKMEMIEVIADFLLNNIETKKKCKPKCYFPFKIVSKINELRFEECKIRIRNGIFYSKYTSSSFRSHRFFKKIFYSVDALLLC